MFKRSTTSKSFTDQLDRTVLLHTSKRWDSRFQSGDRIGARGFEAGPIDLVYLRSSGTVVSDLIRRRCTVDRPPDRNLRVPHDGARSRRYDMQKRPTTTRPRLSETKGFLFRTSSGVPGSRDLLKGGDLRSQRLTHIELSSGSGKTDVFTTGVAGVEERQNSSNDGPPTFQNC